MSFENQMSIFCQMGSRIDCYPLMKTSSLAARCFPHTFHDSTADAGNRSSWPLLTRGFRLQRTDGTMDGALAWTIDAAETDVQGLVSRTTTMIQLSKRRCAIHFSATLQCADTAGSMAAQISLEIRSLAPKPIFGRVPNVRSYPDTSSSLTFCACRSRGQKQRVPRTLYLD